MAIEEATSIEAITQISPGLRLSTERKKQGLTEREVADQLKITLSKLQCIEKDQFDSFPAQIYLKGYLKNYARLLGISEQDISDSYQAHGGQLFAKEVYTPSPDNANPPSSRKKGIFVLLLVVVIAILVFVLYSQTIVSDENLVIDDAVFFEPSIDESLAGLPLDEPSPTIDMLPAMEGETEQNAALAIDSDSATDAQSAESIQAADEPIEMLASKLTAVELINLSMPEVEQEAPELAVVSLNDVLVFRFANQCWIEVRDGTGSLLYSGLENAGSERQIEGEAPFQIVIGNAEGTSLSFNGEGVILQVPFEGRALRLEVGS